MAKHPWTDGDRLVALFLYRYGVTSLGDPIALGEYLGMGASSLVTRLSNFLAVASSGEEGLSNYPSDDERVFKRYAALDRPALEKLVKDYLEGLKQSR